MIPRALPSRYSFKHAVVSSALAVAATMTSHGAHAQAGMLPSFIPNLVGIGIGITPRYSGASENVVGAVPGVRYTFKGTQRFLEMYGPAGDINLIDSATWQLGPAINIRIGRSDVEDEYVSRLPDIDTTLEAGVLGSYTYTHAGDVPWRLRIGATALTNMGDQWHGLDASTFASLWVPLSPRVFLGLGGGLSWGSASFINRYYGISASDSAASGLPAYESDSGVRQYYVWPALVMHLSGNWWGGIGGFYQRLADKAADSPIVSQRGNRNQWTYGIGIGYVWQ